MMTIGGLHGCESVFCLSDIINSKTVVRTPHNLLGSLESGQNDDGVSYLLCYLSVLGISFMSISMVVKHIR